MKEEEKQDLIEKLMDHCSTSSHEADYDEENDVLTCGESNKKPEEREGLPEAIINLERRESLFTTGDEQFSISFKELPEKIGSSELNRVVFDFGDKKIYLGEGLELEEK